VRFVIEIDARRALSRFATKLPGSRRDPANMALAVAHLNPWPERCSREDTDRSPFTSQSQITTMI